MNNVDMFCLSSSMKWSGIKKFGFRLKVRSMYMYVGKMKFEGIKFCFYIFFEYGND